MAPAGARRAHGGFEDCLDCLRLGWIGHPACENASDIEKKLIANRQDIEVIAEIEDENACYSYDSYAIVTLNGDYYLLNTSGCSCPDPKETWSCVWGPGKKDALCAEINAYVEFSVPARQRQQFLEALV